MAVRRSLSILVTVVSRTLVSTYDIRGLHNNSYDHIYARVGLTKHPILLNGKVRPPQYQPYLVSHMV